MQFKAIGLAYLIGLGTTAMAKPAEPTTPPPSSSELLALPFHVGGVVSHMVACPDGLKDTDAACRHRYDYQWPAVYFESAFDGPEVILRFNDAENRLRVRIDDHGNNDLMKYGGLEYRLNNNGPGHHIIRLEKVSESQYATGSFLGFFVSKPENRLPTPTYDRRIEFIGDSYMAGYGNTAEPALVCTEGTVWLTTDSSQAWPVLLAKSLKADYRVQAFSGIGVVRNYDGREHDKYRMPSIYNKALFDDAAPQPADYHPHIMVFALGGNDFSNDLHDGEKWKTREDLHADFEAQYAAFITARRVENPHTWFILITYEPDTAEESIEIKKVYNALKAKGETRLELITLPPQHRTGCNGHLDLSDGTMISTFLKAHIDALPQIWGKHD